MRNNMDERQQGIQGNVMRNALIGLLMIMLLLAFLEAMEIFSILNYMDFSDFCINLTCLTMAYISISLILRDAYFGMFSDVQKRSCRIIFTLFSIVMNILILFDFIKGEAFSPVSISTIIMANGIAVSLWCKHKKIDYNLYNMRIEHFESSFHKVKNMIK